MSNCSTRGRLSSKRLKNCLTKAFALTSLIQMIALLSWSSMRSRTCYLPTTCSTWELQSIKWIMVVCLLWSMRWFADKILKSQGWQSEALTSTWSTKKEGICSTTLSICQVQPQTQPSKQSSSSLIMVSLSIMLTSKAVYHCITPSLRLETGMTLHRSILSKQSARCVVSLVSKSR